jgi:hypothetical protein
MKVVRTTLTEVEYQLLQQYAKSKSVTVNQAIRGAIRKNILDKNVDPQDPLFTETSSSKGTGKKDDGSTKHDFYLYGINK